MPKQINIDVFLQLQKYLDNVNTFSKKLCDNKKNSLKIKKFKFLYNYVAVISSV